MSDIERHIYRGAALPPGVNVTSHPRCGDADRQRAIDRITEAYARGFMEKHEAEARQEAGGAIKPEVKDYHSRHIWETYKEANA